MMPTASTETTVPKIHWALASRDFPIKKTSQALWPRARQLKVWPQCTRGLWTLSSKHSRPHHLQPWQKGSIGDLGNYETWVKHWEDWGSLPNFFQVVFFLQKISIKAFKAQDLAIKVHKLDVCPPLMEPISTSPASVGASALGQLEFLRQTINFQDCNPPDQHCQGVGQSLRSFSPHDKLRKKFCGEATEPSKTLRPGRAWWQSRQSCWWPHSAQEIY